MDRIDVWRIAAKVHRGPLLRRLTCRGTLWVPKTVMLLCLSTRELGEVPLVAFGEVAVVVEAPFEC